MKDELLEVLAKSNNVAIMPHISPDGDCFGACTAFYRIAKKLGKSAVVYIEETSISETFAFLFDDVEVKCGENEIQKYDLAVALDCGDLQRLGERKDIFCNSMITANIDHHITNTKFAKYNFVFENASSTCEILYDFIKNCSMEIDKQTAQSLYTGICTDTGGFRYSNTTPKVHKAAAELISFGLDVASISKRVFEMVSMERLRLQALAILSLELYDEGRLAVITIDEKMINYANAADEDLEGFVNIARSVKGVECAIALRQTQDGKVKASLRSNNSVDVSLFAAKYGGGGHAKASGFTVEGNIKDIKNMVVKDAINYLNKSLRER